MKPLTREGTHRAKELFAGQFTNVNSQEDKHSGNDQIIDEKS